MLRVISIVGIALAMVIGFVALSSKMKDDYSVRSRVVNALNAIKQHAAGELMCAKTVEVPPAVNDPAQSESTDAGQVGEPLATAPGSNGAGTGQQASVPGVDSSTLLVREKSVSDIISRLEIRREKGSEILANAVFKDVSGDTGKLKIKSGSSLQITCRCVMDKIQCAVTGLGVSKNYYPQRLGD